MSFITFVKSSVTVTSDIHSAFSLSSGAHIISVLVCLTGSQVSQACNLVNCFYLISAFWYCQLSCLQAHWVFGYSNLLSNPSSEVFISLILSSSRISSFLYCYLFIDNLILFVCNFLMSFSSFCEKETRKIALNSSVFEDQLYALVQHVIVRMLWAEGSAQGESLGPLQLLSEHASCPLIARSLNSHHKWLFWGILISQRDTLYLLSPYQKVHCVSPLCLLSYWSVHWQFTLQRSEQSLPLSGLLPRWMKQR